MATWCGHHYTLTITHSLDHTTHFNSNRLFNIQQPRLSVTKRLFNFTLHSQNILKSLQSIYLALNRFFNCSLQSLELKHIQWILSVWIVRSRLIPRWWPPRSIRQIHQYLRIKVTLSVIKSPPNMFWYLTGHLFEFLWEFRPTCSAALIILGKTCLGQILKSPVEPVDGALTLNEV